MNRKIQAQKKETPQPIRESSRGLSAGAWRPSWVPGARRVGGSCGKGSKQGGRGRSKGFTFRSQASRGNTTNAGGTHIWHWRAPCPMFENRKYRGGGASCREAESAGAVPVTSYTWHLNCIYRRCSSAYGAKWVYTRGLIMQLEMLITYIL